MNKREKVKIRKAARMLTDAFRRFYASSGTERAKLHRTLTKIRDRWIALDRQYGQSEPQCRKVVETFDKAFHLAGRTRKGW